MYWTAIREWSQKRTLRVMLKDPRAARGFRSIGQLEKAIGADRSTTERLLLAVGALHVGGYEATREAAMAAFAKSLAGGAK